MSELRERADRASYWELSWQEERTTRALVESQLQDSMTSSTAWEAECHAAEASQTLLQAQVDALLSEIELLRKQNPGAAAKV